MKLVLLSPLVLLAVQTITAQSVWSNDPTVNTLVCDAENTQSNAGCQCSSPTLLAEQSLRGRMVVGPARGLSLIFRS